MDFIKNNFKYAAVFAIFWVALMIGYSEKNSVKSDSCVNPKKTDSMAVVAPEISPRGKYYRISNFLNTASGDYYRLAFNTKVDQESEITINLASISGGNSPISSILLEVGEDYASKEVVFKADGFYRDLIFEKKGDNVSKVYIKNVSLSRLNVKSEYEAKLLRPVMLGNTKIVESGARQTEKEEKYFSQLKSSKTKLGQIFKAGDEYMAGVSLDLREKGSSSGKYRLELKEAKEKKGNIAISSEAIASLEFSSNDIEKYKNEEDGKAFFPLASQLEKDRLYFIGISNSLVSNNFLNYLEIRGTDDKNAFPKGEAVVWQDGKVQEIGDLFFVIHSAEFSDFQGERILTGVKIEDMGGGSGLYSHQTSQRSNDILDLFSYKRGDVWFNDYEGIISGSPRNEASYVYRFYSPFAFEKIRIISEQMYAGWYRVVISYSFDNQNWTDLPYDGDGENDSPQKFNSVIDGNGTNKELYIKVTYDKFDEKEIKLFGLRNFSITSELKMK